MVGLDKLRSLRQEASPATDLPTQMPVPPTGSKQVYWVVGGLLFGVLGLFLVTNRQFLSPAVSVVAEPAIAVKVDAQDYTAVSPSQVVFQASGWVEPEPFMTKATAFVEGVVTEVNVLNGQSVKRGDILAKLDDKRLRLAITEAEAEIASMRRELTVAAERKQVAARETTLARKKQETGRAELKRLQLNADVLAKAGDTIPYLAREDARLQMERQIKSIQELIAEQEVKEASTSIAQGEIEVIQERIRSKQASLAKLKLDLERTTIVSPMDGNIQTVYARVGKKVMLADNNMDSATIADVYDPKKLQVRVDVALADAGGLEVGMPTIATTDILSGLKLTGVVTSIVGQADLAKNTLQAKVKLKDPHPKLRPEMLARVEFMPLPKPQESPKASVEQSEAVRVRAFIPEKAIQDKPKGKQSTVWVVSSDGRRAEPKTITLGAGRQSSWVEVAEGIHPGERVIISPYAALKPGCRIAIKPSNTEQP